MLLVATAALGPIGFAASAAAAPDGFVTLPDSNVQEDLPVGTSASLRASDLEGSVMASSHASSLQVVVTTPDRASSYVNGTTVGGGGGVALIFMDDTNHQGRRVAVPADAVREAVGHVPEVVHGVHEDGSSWTSPVDARNGLLIFEIPKFSANSVTFEGTASITASPAVDGSSYSYELGSPDIVDDYQINVTGSTATAWDNESATALSDGDTMSLSVGGDGEPTGPSAGEPVVRFTGRSTSVSDSFSGTGAQDGDTTSFSISGDDVTNGKVTFTGKVTTSNGDVSGSGVSPGETVSVANPGNIAPTGPGPNGDPELTLTAQSGTQTVPSLNEDSYKAVLGADRSGEVQINNVGGVITEVRINVFSGSTGAYSDIYIVKGEGVDGTTGEGTQVASDVQFASSGWTTVDVQDVVVGSSQTVTVEFRPGASASDLAQIWTDSSSSTSTMSAGTASDPNLQNAWGHVRLTTGPTVSATVDGTTHSYGAVAPGQSETLEVPLAASTSSIDFTGAGTAFNWTLAKTDRNATENPGVDLDGDGSPEGQYTGVLRQGDTATVALSGLTTGSQTATFLSAGAGFDWTIAFDRLEFSENPGVDIDGDGTPDANYQGILEPGETATADLSGLSTSTTQLTVQTAGSTIVDTAVLFEERTLTTNPRVIVNGHETGGAAVGTLADGETASLDTDTSWIVDGTNNVSVQVGDGTLSSDAPTPQVGLNYSHSAEVLVSTSYVGGSWVERYNVSYTFSGDREDPTVTVPFSNTIYDIRTVEQRVGDGAWTSVPSSDWTLQNGTTLVVHVSDADGSTGVEAGDTIALRTTGYKANAVDGSITVTDPTTPADATLDAGIRIDSVGDQFRIGVGGTEFGDRLHYAHSESWKSPAETAVIGADGTQALFFPNAKAGGSARITTLPVKPIPANGDVGVSVVDADGPVLAVGPGNAGAGSEVTFRYLGSSAGETYGLYSLDAKRYVDKSEAGAAFVDLVDDDSEEQLAIKQPSSDGLSGTGSGGGVGGNVDVSGSGIWSEDGPGVLFREIAVVVAWAALVLLLVAATARSSLTGRRRWAAVGVVSLASGLLSLEILRPGTVSNAVSGGLQEIIPLAGLAAIGIIGYSIVSWWQARQAEASTPETKVSLNLGRLK
ncbi:hypothetical protein [Halobaculum sp. P14]|uniref:hypothetical protein n=1 Tax=Halobaculum sp. P14 TaxID=3421638 RepID=UPI003EBA1699